jgi:hypothetical protein
MSAGIIFDHHALAAVGHGHRTLAGYVVQAHQDPLFVIAVPAVCLAEAARQRPAVSTHVAQLPAIEVQALDQIGADTMGRIAQTLRPAGGWPVLHAVTAALTTGWEIATTHPEDYKGFGVPLLPVAP